MERHLKLVPPWGNQASADPCGCNGSSPIQIVTDALHYFSLHFGEPQALTALAQTLGISRTCLEECFDRIRGMTPAEALQQHRLNRLFGALSAQPRQGLHQAIHNCGLGHTRGTLALFEETFGIAMPLFLLSCRRADDDRRCRRDQPAPATP